MVPESAAISFVLLMESQSALITLSLFICIIPCTESVVYQIL